MNDFSALVDLDRCTVSPRVFNDQDVYEAELEKIFTRTWNMIGHERQLPNANDYLTTFIGADPVLLTRDAKGKV